MFKLFAKKNNTVKPMSATELNEKYNPINSSDPYVQYALTGSIEHAAKYAHTTAQKKAFADAKAGEDAYNRIFSKKSDDKHKYVAVSDIGMDHDAFNKMMNDPDVVLIFK